MSVSYKKAAHANQTVWDNSTHAVVYCVPCKTQQWQICYPQNLQKGDTLDLMKSKNKSIMVALNGATTIVFGNFIFSILLSLLLRSEAPVGNWNLS